MRTRANSTWKQTSFEQILRSVLVVFVFGVITGFASGKKQASTTWDDAAFQALTKTEPLSRSVVYPGYETKGEPKPVAREMVWQKSVGKDTYRVRKVERVDGQLYSWVYSQADSSHVVYYRKIRLHEKIVRTAVRKGGVYSIEEHSTEKNTADVSRSTIDAEKNSIVGPDLGRVLARSLPEMKKGKTITFNMVLPSLSRSIDFDFKYAPKSKVPQVVMTASSFLIRAVVDPATYTFDSSKPPRLVRYQGRTNIDEDFFKLEKPEVDLRTTYLKP